MGGGWKALQYGASITYSAWVFIAPSINLCSAGSRFARGWYGDSWFVESLSHAAMISPVITNDCGPSHFPSSCKLRALVSINLVDSPSVWNLTVVSVVDGKVFSKSLARSGSFMRDVTSRITRSMASD